MLFDSNVISRNGSHKYTKNQHRHEAIHYSTLTDAKRLNVT